MNRRFKELDLEPFIPDGAFSAAATITARLRGRTV
jgi:hypothetical protein